MKLFTSKNFITVLVGSLAISFSAYAGGMHKDKTLNKNMDKNVKKEYSQKFEPGTNNTTATEISTKMTIKEAQRNLNNNGYNLSIDGIVGPNTRKAIRGFQADQGIAATGKLDQNTLRALNVNSDQFDRAPASVDENDSDSSWYDDTEEPDLYRDDSEGINEPSM